MITTKSKSYEEQVKLFAEHIKEAGAIVVGEIGRASLGEQPRECQLPQATGTTMNGIRTL